MCLNVVKSLVISIINFVFNLDDKDLLRKKALTLSKEKCAVLATTTNKPPIARKSLQFEGDEELHANDTENSVMQPTDSSMGATSGTAKKRVADEVFNIKIIIIFKSIFKYF